MGPSGTKPKKWLIQDVAAGPKRISARVWTRKTAEQTNTRSFTPGVMNPRQSKLYRRAPNVVIESVYGRRVSQSKSQASIQLLAGEIEEEAARRANMITPN